MSETADEARCPCGCCQYPDSMVRWWIEHDALEREPGTCPCCQAWLLDDGSFVPFVELLRAGTLPMTPVPELGYDPMPLILRGEKTHTLRGQSRRVGSIAEVTCGVGTNKKRTGLIVRFLATTRMTPDEYLTDEFAWADGIRPEEDRPAVAMLRLFESFYPGEILCARWRLDFEVLVALEDMPGGGGLSASADEG